MPRIARKINNNGVYHVIIRGIGQQDLFFDEQDRRKMIKEIKNTKEQCGFVLYSYILMPNHVHLQIKDMQGYLAKGMQHLCMTYASYFNRKYDRIGHVFQERYKSKIIESEPYFYRVMRYIHQNSVKAGIGVLEDYPWSSYPEYVKGKGIADITNGLNLWNEDLEKALKDFVDYHKEMGKAKNGVDLAYYQLQSRVSDQEVMEILLDQLPIKSIQEMQRYDKKKRREILKEIVKIEGIPKKQLARVLGISRKIIERETKRNFKEVENVHL